jgi:hypothetical protein
VRLFLVTHKVRIKEQLELEHRHEFKVLLVLEIIYFSCF